MMSDALLPAVERFARPSTPRHTAGTVLGSCKPVNRPRLSARYETPLELSASPETPFIGGIEEPVDEIPTGIDFHAGTSP